MRVFGVCVCVCVWCVCVYTEAQGVPKDFPLLLAQEAEGHSVYLCIMYCTQECVRVCTCLLVCFCVIPMGLLKQSRTVQLQIPVLICFFCPVQCSRLFTHTHTHAHPHTHKQFTHQCVLVSFDEVMEGCCNLLSRLCFLKIPVHRPIFLLQRRGEEDKISYYGLI